MQKITITMNHPRLKIAGILLMTLSIELHAEVFTLDTIVVEDSEASHPSQQTRKNVEDATQDTRSSTSTDGNNLQNLNSINTRDALRFTTPGLVGFPGSDRFGGPVSIRTYGDFGASTSIDGLPAIKFQDEEGGGYSNSRIPTIAIEGIEVHKGGRGVGFGNGSDGGVFQTNIKSGLHYKDHIAGSLDVSDAGESIIQIEAADHNEKADYYVAGSYLYGDFNGTHSPSNLDEQKVGSGVAKFGYNPSEKTRIQLLAIKTRSDTDIYRNDDPNSIRSDTDYAALTADHAISDDVSLRTGYQYSDTDTYWPARDRDRNIKINSVFTDLFITKELSEQVDYAGTVGAEYRTTNSHRDNQWDNTFDDYAVKLNNAFIFNDNATVTFGLRNTWFDNDIELNDVTQPDNLDKDTVVSWEIGGAYTVAGTTRIRGSVATGYNRFYEKYGNFGTDALNPAGAEDEIVESLTYEVGANYGFSKGYIDLAYYNITQENVPRREGGAIESVEVEQSGIELEAFAAVTDKLTVTAGYTYTLDVEATRDDGTDANGNIFFGSNGVNITKNQVILRLNYDLNDTFSLWGAAIYSDPFERENADGETEDRRRSYERFDLGGAMWVNDKIALRTRVENLTNKKDFSETLEGNVIDTDGKLGRVFWLGLDFSI